MAPGLVTFDAFPACFININFHWHFGRMEAPYINPGPSILGCPTPNWTPSLLEYKELMMMSMTRPTSAWNSNSSPSAVSVAVAVAALSARRPKLNCLRVTGVVLECARLLD